MATVSTWGASPRPAEAATSNGVTVIVACRANPETTWVKNNRNSRITIGSVGSIYQPRTNEPFRVGRVLRLGRAVRFESGYDADMNVLTRWYIYNNDVVVGERGRGSRPLWVQSSTAAARLGSDRGRVGLDLP
jgi:hypothetical protein